MGKSKKKVDGKINIGFFFSVQVKIVKELFSSYTLQSIFIVLLSLVTIFEQLIELKLLEYLTNKVFYYINSELTYFSDIIFHLMLFIVLLIIIKIAQSIYGILVEKYESKIFAEAERKIVKKLSLISYEHYERNEFYEDVNLAKKASGQYTQAVYGITQMINIIVMLIAYGILLSQISILYVLVIVFAIIISIILSARTTDKQLDFWRKHVSPETRKREYFSDILNNRVNHQNIQINRAFSYFGKKFTLYNRYERNNYLKLNMYSFTTELFTSFTFLATYCVTALLVGKGVINGTYEIGYYSMVIALLANMFITIKRFSQFILNKSWYVRILDAYYKILQLPDDSINRDITHNKLVELDNISYRYSQADKYALKGISFSFNEGSKIAIVGENGSGKSTIISIILNLLSEYQGRYSQADVAKSAVLQDFVQYQMTIKENIEISCGGEELPEEKIIEILDKVGLLEEVLSKEKGIYTQLGQLCNGAELSKGQWQRIAIARLLANEKAKIWILDEPTAYLDPLAEIEMYKLIFELAENRLVFFISHRLGFARNADMIMVVKDGQIAESGTHTELMQNVDGEYSRMYRLQQSWYK